LQADSWMQHILFQGHWKGDVPEQSDNQSLRVLYVNEKWDFLQDATQLDYHSITS